MFCNWKRAFIALAGLAAALAPASASAAVYRQIYSFRRFAVANPTGGLAIDKSGVLFGYALSYALGNPLPAIYKFDPSTKTFTLIYTARPGLKDGASPVGTPALSPKGELFGINSLSALGGHCGNLFKLNTASGKFRILHNFQCDQALPAPATGMVRDSFGNLFGSSTNTNGTYYIFRVDGKSEAFTPLHTFSGVGNDVFNGQELLLRNGLLYFSLCNGGANGKGSINTIDTASGNLNVLYAFTGQGDGSCPNGNIVADSAGALYGTEASYAGAPSGAIFKLAKTGTQATLIHTFDPMDGTGPVHLSINEKPGLLYGLSRYDGVSHGPTLFKLNIATLKYENLQCCGNVSTGNGLYATTGKFLYGIDNLGGSNGIGNIFEFIQ